MARTLLSWSRRSESSKRSDRVGCTQAAPPPPRRSNQSRKSRWSRKADQPFSAAESGWSSNGATSL